jgi:hypothetical protein
MFPALDPDGFLPPASPDFVKVKLFPFYKGFWCKYCCLLSSEGTKTAILQCNRKGDAREVETEATPDFTALLRGLLLYHC